ncbi:MAG: rhomboid family intramembrane serine protease [Mucilaginibacter sp.]
MIFLVSMLGLFNKKVFFQFILHPVSVVKNKQFYRVFTADWMNADFLYLVLNEFMLYVFCSDLEENLRSRSANGSLHFLVIYASSLIIGSSVIIVRHFKDFNYSTTGTSGSIMGCMFSFMLLAPAYPVYQLPIIGEVKNIYGGLIYILMLVIYQWRKKEDMINHEFHFYGAIGGILATLMLYPQIL